MYCEEKHEKKASNTAKTALGLGIAGTTLGVINSGWLGGKSVFGRGKHDGYGDGYGYEGHGGCGRHSCAATCDDLLEVERQFNGVQREIGSLALGFEKQLGAEALYQQGLTFNLALKSQKDDCELAMKEACDVRDLYRYNDKTAFELYKGQRDAYDKTQSEIGKLKTEVAEMKAIRPYQDKIIALEILDARKDARFELEREMCRVVKGEVVLPLTPEVTGVASITCRNKATAGTAAAA